MNSRLRIRLVLLVYTLGIVVVSLIPSTGVSLWNLDKVGHYFAYAGLAVLVCLNLEWTHARVAGLIGAVVLGALLEGAQSFVPGRDMSLVDGAANTLGVLSGAVIFRLREGDLRRRAAALLRRRRGRNT